MKLYKVNATITYVVLAENIQDAITVARGTLKDAVMDQGEDDFDIAANNVAKKEDLPFGWKDPSILPYSISQNDWTIGEILEAL